MKKKAILKYLKVFLKNGENTQFQVPQNMAQNLTKDLNFEDITFFSIIKIYGGGTANCTKKNKKIIRVSEGLPNIST